MFLHVSRQKAKKWVVVFEPKVRVWHPPLFEWGRCRLEFFFHFCVKFYKNLINICFRETIFLTFLFYHNCPHNEDHFSVKLIKWNWLFVDQKSTHVSKVEQNCNGSFRLDLECVKEITLSLIGENTLIINTIPYRHYTLHHAVCIDTVPRKASCSFDLQCLLKIHLAIFIDTVI